MLYLEDYLEIIEHLPQELRERFTEMREMDLSVQNNTDALDKRVRALFQQCRRGEISTPMADSEFDSIRTNYYRVLDDSDEKIQLAAQMYDLVERYLRRLDTELFKFKCELEADHNGITEVLEKRSLELDTTTTNGSVNQKENRFYDTQNSHGGGSGHTPSSRSDSRYKVKAEKRRNSVAASVSHGAIEKRPGAGSSKPLNNTTVCGQANVSPVIAGAVPGTGAVAMVGSVATATVVAGAVVPGTVPGTPTVASSYNLQTCGAGNAIVAAASQAIAQTQQMQQGRRTASLKASYEAIGGVGSHELLLNSELAGATHNALQAVERESTAFSNQRRNQKKKSVSVPHASGNLRPNTSTMLANVSTVTSMLPSSASNVQSNGVSQSPISSVALQVHSAAATGTSLQPQQQQQQSFIQQHQQQQQQQTLNHVSSVQSQQLLIHTNTPVVLQQQQQHLLQPVIPQITLPQQTQPALKQQLTP
uniref:Inhibitor of growth protein N-terminal histone-binding domain-containing protein n=1 Tax=Anopheles dirus TaxID=7168 RepID=A0A182NVQ1_9DIPT